MDFSSSPKYRAYKKSRFATVEQAPGLALPPRATRILLDLLLLLTFGVAFYLVRQMTFERSPLPPRTPLEFRFIQERIDKILGRSLDSVVALLGPPSELFPHEPEFEDCESMVHIHPDRYPSGELLWTKWTDPQDEHKWVAVLFVGDEACKVVKKGF